MTRANQTEGIPNGAKLIPSKNHAWMACSGMVSDQATRLQLDEWCVKFRSGKHRVARPAFAARHA
jgi:hypothetical protein